MVPAITLGLPAQYSSSMPLQLVKGVASFAGFHWARHIAMAQIDDERGNLT